MFIRNQEAPAVTVLSNAFVDYFMAEANGEFVKIYLYLLRMSQMDGVTLKITDLADHLNDTENDVMRALRYWEKQGLLLLEEEEGVLLGLQLLPVPVPSQQPVEPKVLSPAAGEAAVSASEDKSPEVKPETVVSVGEVSQEARERLKSSEDFKQVLFVAETYLGRTLSPKDVDLFSYLYDGLNFSVELLEYLVEYCVGGGHKSLRYMESVALNWHNEGKRTVQDAKDSQKAYSRENKEVMKAFGIVGRILTQDERKYVDRWVKEYELPLSVITEGCACTMAAIHQPSFDYTEKILEDWFKAGIRTVEEAKAYRNQRKTVRGRNEQAGSENRNRFQNYTQREIDYDALLNQNGLNPYGNG